jgi:hypothetical protein
MGVLDEAFRSRIHVPLYFNDLTDEDRKQIWKNNIERLGETKIRITKEAQEYLVSQEVMALEWNGREIRNGKQEYAPKKEYQLTERKHFKRWWPWLRQNVKGRRMRSPRLRKAMPTRWSGSRRNFATT